MYKKSIIFGIKGTQLSLDERIFLKKTKPWGIILFSRNIKNFDQLIKLTDNIKKIFSDVNYPILIDQEGGNVSRFNKIIDMSLFSQNYFGDLYHKNIKTFKYYYEIYVNRTCDIIKKAGININTVPVLDVRRYISHKIIGTRSFSIDPVTVSKLGNLCIELFNKNKIGTVSKHIPGHGMAKSDSHCNLPSVNTKKSQLIKNDFFPFKFCKSFFAMTAHVIFSKYDPINTATHSKIIINDVIRKHIGFKGILISDDISMKALKYGLKANSIKALDAGCNLILHCNGNIKEMNELAKIIPTIDKFTQEKTSDFYKFLE